MSKVPPSASYAVAKSLNAANACAFYLGVCITELQATGGVKDFFKGLQNRANGVVREMRSRVKNPELSAVLDAELSDPLVYDALLDAFTSLTVENKVKAEQFMLDLINQQEKK